MEEIIELINQLILPEITDDYSKGIVDSQNNVILFLQNKDKLKETK